jgi:hypothetical protein
MNRPSKKEIKAAVDKLKEQKSGQGPSVNNAQSQLSGKKGNQGKIRKQGV